MYVARAMIYEIDRPLRDSDWALLKFWGKFVQYCLKNTDILDSPTHPKDFDTLIESLLAHKPVSEQQYTDILSSFGWKASDQYLCISFGENNYDEKSGTILSLCANLEIRFSNSAALRVKNRILLVINIDRLDTSYDDFLQIFSVFLREGILKAGISNIFTDLKDIDVYYRQAQRALELGEKVNYTYWSYFYEKYAYLDMRSNAAKDYTLLALCPTGIKELIQYDIDHGHNFTYTLITYLNNNCNLARCTRILYLQRSTLLYQIKRIREITKMNISSMDTQKWILFYFSILEANHIDVRDIHDMQQLNIVSRI